MVYFKKENIRSEVRGADQKPIVFQPVFGSAGVLALDEVKDAATISSLNAYAEKRVGGVVVISAEIYEALKKNEGSTSSPKQSSLNRMRVSPSPESFGLKVGAPRAVDADRTKGITIMEEDQIPPSSIGQFRERARSRPVGGPPAA